MNISRRNRRFRWDYDDTENKRIFGDIGGKMKENFWNRNIKDKKRYKKVKCTKCGKEDNLSDDLENYICERCWEKLKKNKKEVIKSIVSS